MKYTMKAGVLYNQNYMLAQIKGILTGPEKKILSPNGVLLLQTDIHTLNAPAEKKADVRFRKYILSDVSRTPYAIGKPGYAKEEDPSNAGWPICRMPKVDHVQILIHDKDYLLVMRNSQNYHMKKSSGNFAIEIFHRGLGGGWEIEAEDEITPEMICGIFIFCRYLEQENEFLIV